MFIWIVVLGWLYVALMMSLAEAMHPSGGWLGAVFTFLLYGVGPVALVTYLLGTPLRRKQRRRREADERAAERAAQLAASGQGIEPDAGRHASGDAAAAEGKEA